MGLLCAPPELSSYGRAPCSTLCLLCLLCSATMLRHDPLAYRPLLLRLAQSGAEVAPLGALRLLGAYSR